MAEAWRYFKIGLYGGIGFLAAYGVVRLLLALLEAVFGHAPKIPW